MFEASSVYFQYVNERAALVKIDHVPVGVDLGRSKILISLIFGWFSTTGFFINKKLKVFGSIRMIF